SERVPLETSNGPSTRNSIAARSKLNAEPSTGPRLRHASALNRPDLYPASTVARPTSPMLSSALLGRGKESELKGRKTSISLKCLTLAAAIAVLAAPPMQARAATGVGGPVTTRLTTEA